MRSALLGFAVLSLAAVQTSIALAQAVAMAPPITHLRSHSTRKDSPPILLMNGSRLQIGDERYTLEIAPQTGRMIRDGKTREFRSIVGLQPIHSQQGWIAPLTDELVIKQTTNGFREYVLPWKTISKITVAKTVKGSYFQIHVSTRAGKTETFGGDWNPQCAVEVEWTDSIARERFSFLSVEGAVIELDQPPEEEKVESPK
jgi:hypothetical protein